MWYMRVGPSEKIERKILNLQGPDLPVPLNFIQRKATIFLFYFLCRSCWFARTYLPMEKARQMKWGFEFEQ